MENKEAVRHALEHLRVALGEIKQVMVRIDLANNIIKNLYIREKEKKDES